MNKLMVITCCTSCPIRKEKESHGPSDSDFWVECGITGEMIDGWDAPISKINWRVKDHLRFPESCPLKDTKQKPTK